MRLAHVTAERKRNEELSCDIYFPFKRGQRKLSQRSYRSGGYIKKRTGVSAIRILLSRGVGHKTAAAGTVGNGGRPGTSYEAASFCSYRQTERKVWSGHRSKDMGKHMNKKAGGLPPA